MSDSEEIFDFELEVDDRLNGILTFICKRCGRKQKRKLQELKPNSDIICGCGATGTISDDGFRSVQKELDQLKKSLANF